MDALSALPPGTKVQIIITQHPLSRQQYTHENAAFQVEASCVQAISYQWYFEGKQLEGN